MDTLVKIPTRSFRRMARPAIGGALLALGLPSVAFAGLPGDVTTLRDRAGLRLGDADFQGENVAVVWSEPLAGDPAVRIRTSTAAGTVFAATELVVEKSRQPSVDLCAGQVFVAYSHDYDDTIPAGWAIDLRTRAMGVTGFTGAAVSQGQYPARHPDIACAGGRLFVAWLERQEGIDRVLISDSLRASLAFEVPIDLGEAAEGFGSEPVVAGVGNRAYVAWRAGNQIRFKRFGIGGAPGHTVTPYGDVVVGPGGSARPSSMPVIAADGPRVVVAWQRCGDTLARVSTDRGATWGPVRTVREGFCGAEAGAYPTGVAILGDRIAITYAWRSPAGDQERVVRSRSDLASSTDVRLGPGADLQLFGWVTFPEAIGWQSARDRGSLLTYIRHGNTTP